MELPVSQLALESSWISLQDLELRLLYDVRVVLEVLTAGATALWAAVNALSKALTVELEALGL